MSTEDKQKQSVIDEMSSNYAFELCFQIDQSVRGETDEFHQSFRHKFPRAEVALFAARILPLFTFPIDFAENSLQRL